MGTLKKDKKIHSSQVISRVAASGFGDYLILAISEAAACVLRE